MFDLLSITDPVLISMYRHANMLIRMYMHYICTYSKTNMLINNVILYITDSTCILCNNDSSNLLTIIRST